MKKCKMCKNEAKNNRIYCSNECKWSDSELNSKRISKEKNNPNKKIKCNICEWETKDILNKGGYPKKHLKIEHFIIEDDYLQYYTEIEKEKVETWDCPMCDWKSKDLKNASGWITTHITKKHDITLLEFIEKYDVDKSIFGKQLNIELKDKDMESEDNRIICQMCGKSFYKLTQTHLQKHNITPTEYMKKFNIDNTSSNKVIKKQSDMSNDPIRKANMIKKIIKTNNKKYGNNSYTQSDIGKSVVRGKTILNTYNKYVQSDRLNEYVELLFSMEEYDGNLHNEYEFKCRKCNNIFIGKLENGRIPRCFNCYPRINKGYSESERILANYIENDLNVDIIRNDKSLGIELDIFIPGKNIAIEYDGIYWHSELNGKDKKYHLNKTEICEKNDIKLIHIFEDEWIHKPDIVKNRLQILLKKSEKVIYARNCNIKKINITDKNNFLERYHLQGKDIAPVKLGLYYKNELISVATFSKYRFQKTKNTHELNRYAIKNTIIIIGGFNKLLKHFIKNYKPDSIITYADRRWSNLNNIYEISGFNFIKYTIPSYWYFDKSQNRIHRFNFKKNLLHKKLKKFDAILTEWENMQLNGYDRIWDCGHLKYEMIIKPLDF